MFRCLSHRVAVGIILAATLVFCAGCETRKYHLVCYTDPPNCGPCADDAPKVEHFKYTMDVRFLDPDKSPDHKIPYYKFYSPDGKLLYKGHDIDKVRPHDR